MKQIKELGLSQTIELAILSNTMSKFFFSDNETNLDNVIVSAISVASAAITKGTSGRAVMSTVETSKGYLTLADASKKEYNAQIPLELFLKADPIIYIKPKLVSIRNSYVDLPLINAVAIPAGPPPGFSIVFTFYYENFNPQKHVLNGLGEVVEELDYNN